MQPPGQHNPSGAPMPRNAENVFGKSAPLSKEACTCGFSGFRFRIAPEPKRISVISGVAWGFPAGEEGERGEKGTRTENHGDPSNEAWHVSGSGEDDANPMRITSKTFSEATVRPQKKASSASANRSFFRRKTHPRGTTKEEDAGVKIFSNWPQFLNSASHKSPIKRSFYRWFSGIYIEIFSFE